MLRAGFRVAVGLVRSGDAQHRWRLVAILAGTAILTLSVLLAASALAAVNRQAAREEARSPRVSQSPEPTDVFTRPSSDRWRDRVISVVWIEPVVPAARHTSGAGLAAGMRALPAPGCSVVSPGLARIIRAERGMAARYPCWSLLADSGVRNADELLAYTRPHDPGGLGDLATAIHYEGGHLLGAGPVVRDERIGAFADADRITWWQLSIGLAGLVLLPALVVVVVSVSAASPLRERRIRLLHALGAPAATVRLISGCEVLLLAAPASVVAGLAWWVATRLGLGRAFGVLDGDLDLSAGTIGGLAGLSVAGAVAVVLLAQRDGAATQASTALSRADIVPVSRLAFVPMFVAAALLFASSIVGGSQGVTLKMLGALVSVAGTPLLIPLVGRWLGGIFAASPRPMVWLAGRALQWAPRRRARPFLGLGTLVAVLFLGVGYVTAVRQAESPPPTSYGPISAVGVSWDPQATPSLDNLISGIPRSIAVAVSADEHEHDGVADSHATDRPDDLLVVATCPQLDAVGLRVTCDANDPLRLSTVDGRRLGSAIARSFNDEPASVRLVSRADLGQDVGRAVVLSRLPARRLDELVRTSAQAAVSAPTVSSIENSRPVRTAAAEWIGGSFAAAAAILSLAVVIAIVDRLLGSRRSWQHLLNLGLTRRRLAGLDLQLLAQPWLAAVGTGCAVGPVVAAVMGDPGDGYPWSGAAVVVGATAMLSVVAGVAVFTLAIRAAIPERE